jgi:hypothetical protein
MKAQLPFQNVNRTASALMFLLLIYATAIISKMT